MCLSPASRSSMAPAAHERKLKFLTVPVLVLLPRPLQPHFCPSPPGSVPWRMTLQVCNSSRPQLPPDRRLPQCPAWSLQPWGANSSSLLPISRCCPPTPRSLPFLQSSPFTKVSSCEACGMISDFFWEPGQKRPRRDPRNAVLALGCSHN